jgi:hypothetical protein
MKYKIKRTELPKEVFKPFSLTITFETKEEYRYFHDKIAPQMYTTAHSEFMGDFYTTGNGSKDEESHGVVKNCCTK